MQDVNLFSGHVFDLSSEDFKMSTEEKHSIALQYLTSETFKMNKDDVIPSSMLPYCCLLF